MLLCTVLIKSAARKGLTRYFAKEYAGSWNIREDSVAPVGQSTLNLCGVKRQYSVSIVSKLRGMTALGRLGNADDVGMFVASLAFEQLRFVNAQRIGDSCAGCSSSSVSERSMPFVSVPQFFKPSNIFMNSVKKENRTGYWCLKRHR